MAEEGVALGLPPHTAVSSSSLLLASRRGRSRCYAHTASAPASQDWNEEEGAFERTCADHDGETLSLVSLKVRPPLVPLAVSPSSWL